MLTYGDGVCDVDLSALLAFHRAHGRIATVTAVRPPARFGGLIFDGDLVREFTEKPRSARAGSTAASSCSSRRCSTTSTATDSSLEADALERLAADRQLAAYRHEGFWQCMDTLRDKRLLESLWESGDAPVEGLGVSELVLASTARPSSPARPAWSAAGWSGGCSTRAPTSSASCATGCRSASSSAPGCSTRCSVVRGDVRDQALLERALGEYEIDTVLHLAAQTIVGDRQPQPGLDVRDQHRGTWALLEACRRSPTVEADRRSRRPTRPTATTSSCPTTRTTPLQGRHPYDVSKSCADLIAQSYATPTACRS